MNASARRTSVGIYMPFLSPNRGGPDLTAMWLVQALCASHDVTLITTKQFELDFFNRFTGTTLSSKNFSVRRLPSLPSLHGAPMSALQGPLFQRLARRCASEFDVNISAMNTIDFGVRAIHFLSDLNWLGESNVPPAGNQPEEPRSALRMLYHRICLGLYKESGRNILQQDVLVSNSQWVASALRDLGIDSPIIYPPVPLVPHPIEWNKKQPDFVWIGRITPSKKLEMAINIVGKLRDTGLSCKLHVVGNAIDRSYETRVRDFARAKGDWVIFEGPLYGGEKARLLARFRYAIHTQANEAFGITIVELIKSGCIPFGPDSCGGAEILNHDDLLFNDEEVAAGKILRALQDPSRLESLRHHLHVRAELFSLKSFCSSVQHLVAHFLEQDAGQFVPIHSPVEIRAGTR